jgi:hypothetical protein
MMLLALLWLLCFAIFLEEVDRAPLIEPWL